MTHRFPIKEIAQQAGLSTATIDRALNERAHVSPQTKARVQAAMSELELQEHQLAAKGRRVFVDFVIEAPKRFSDEVRRACEAVLGDIGPAVVRPRFHTQEIVNQDDLLSMLAKISQKRSQGLCLKARNTPAVAKAVADLEAKGIPVFTLVTDIPGSGRQGYVGLDNYNAGKTAAYLLARSVGEARGNVITTVSREDFRGETDRLRGFRETLAVLRPRLELVDIAGGAGLFANTLKRVGPLLSETDDIVGVYSMGGGNKAILSELPEAGGTRPVFIAHDLDRENLELLKAGRVDFVLHHDLKSDMRTLLGGLVSFHGLAPRKESFAASDIQVVTPFNIPQELR